MDHSPGTILVWVGVTATALTLALTVITILFEMDSAAQFLELTDALLSWEVISGSVLIAGGATFKTQIGAMIDRICRDQD
jgi:hypothetical protein